VAITYICTFISLKYNKLINENKAIGDRKDKPSSSAKTMNANITTLEDSEIAAEGAFFSPMLNNEGNKILFSNGDNILELNLITKEKRELTDTGNCYNPSYNRSDNNILTFARTDGIYVIDLKKNNIRAVVTTSNPQISFAKPNFTKDNSIIYYRVNVIPKSDGHGFVEKDPAIYKVTLDGKHEEKLIDGYNPILTYDSKNLIYEWNDNLCIMDLESRNVKVIGKGKYASISHDSKYISFAKYDRETAQYGKVKNNKLFIDKEYSNIYIANINNPNKEYKITQEEYEDESEEIDNWAKESKDSKTEQHFLVVSKMSYFDTAWSADNKYLYISCYNADKGDFELLKYDIAIKAK
jgi:hypothetical protein